MLVWCCLGAADGSGAVFEFVSVVLAMLALHPQKQCISASTGPFLPIFDCNVSDDDWAGLAIYLFWYHLCVEGSTGVFFNSFSLFLGCFSKVMHLGFSLAISAHLLTVLYPMMLGSVKQYGGLGVNWLL